VLASFEGATGELGVRRRRRDDHDDADVGVEDRLSLSDEVDAGAVGAEAIPCIGAARADGSEPGEFPGDEPIEHLEVRRQDVPGADETDPDPAAEIFSGRHDRTYHQKRLLQSSGREPSISAQWFDTGITGVRQRRLAGTIERPE